MDELSKKNSIGLFDGFTRTLRNGLQEFAKQMKSLMEDAIRIFSENLNNLTDNKRDELESTVSDIRIEKYVEEFIKSMQQVSDAQQSTMNGWNLTTFNIAVPIPAIIHKKRFIMEMHPHPT